MIKLCKDKTFYTYILRCSDHTLYTGITNNLEKRLYAHNNLKSGAKYTSLRRPVNLIYFEKYETKKYAILREFEIKKMSRLKKLELVSKGL